jgi:hypothetical protein
MDLSREPDGLFMERDNENRVTCPPVPLRRALAALLGPPGRQRGYRARHVEELATH